MSSKQEYHSGDRPETEDALLDEEDEDVEDDQSVGTLTQGMSNMGVQKHPSSQWSITDHNQGQDASSYDVYSTLPPGRHDAADNGKGSSYNANAGPPQGEYPPPRWQSSVDSTIRTSNPGISYELNDRHFKVHESRKFKCGKVFKIMWSEPFGSNGTAITSRAPTRHAGFSKMRRFVILSCFDGHCLCL